MSSDSSGLGSLSQEARSSQLGTARGILLFIGVLTVAANAFFYTQIEKQVDEELNKQVQALRGQGMIADPVELKKIRESAIQIAKLIQGGAVLLGVVFIIMGVMVKQYPVPITITALVLYIGATAIFGFIEPSSLIRGIIIKVIIVVALAKSVQTALAYQREQDAARMRVGGMGQAPTF
jgi:hypothetical protein